MREILFRAKRSGKDEWVQGYLTKIWGMLRIIDKHDENKAFVIDDDTIGQYTGLKDKNGRKIFEGDILEAKNKITFNTVVKYGEYTPNYFMKLMEEHRGRATNTKFYGLYCETLGTENKELVITNSTQYFKVIGNIHDNPEFLTGGTRWKND